MRYLAVSRSWPKTLGFRDHRVSLLRLEKLQGKMEVGEEGHDKECASIAPAHISLEQRLRSAPPNRVNYHAIGGLYHHLALL
jgi:hypothetical protein